VHLLSITVSIFTVSGSLVSIFSAPNLDSSVHILYPPSSALISHVARRASLRFTITSTLSSSQPSSWRHLRSSPMAPAAFL
ncbi:hypothetical protein FRB93_009928, partial [Tulasnella sp. JGI-2019a]